MESYSNHIQDIYQKIKNNRSIQTRTLSDLSLYSFEELRNRIGDTLSWSDTRRLYNQSKKAYKQNKICETQILSKRNPQLANNIKLALKYNSLERGYDDLFGGRANRYSRPGSVASMFSPAGYLTEMYREARDLHYDSSIFNLNKRRPDLAELTLSQDNMDKEVSTLELSNEVLLALYNQKYGGSLPIASIYQLLAQHVRSGETPYNHYYETLHNCITLQDPGLTQLSEYRELYNLGNSESFLGVVSHISPELYQILIEPLTNDVTDILYQKYFGDIPEDYLTSAEGLREYYGLTNDEVRLFIGEDKFTDGYIYDDYVNDQLIWHHPDKDSNKEFIQISRKYGSGRYYVNFIALYPLGGDEYQVKVKFTESYGESYGLYVDSREVELRKEPALAGITYSFQLSLPKFSLEKAVTIQIRRYSSGGIRATNAEFYYQEYTSPNFILKLNKAIRLYKATGLAPEILTRIFTHETGHYVVDHNSTRRLFYTLTYQQRHQLPATEAVVMAGADINPNVEMDENISQFDRLFNNPPLNGQYFEPDDKTLFLDDRDSASVFKTNALKRAFNLDHAELRQLVYLYNKNDRFNNSLYRLSGLYRLKSFADLNGLTLYELASLFDFIPKSTTPNNFTESEWQTLGEYIYDLAQWLRKHQITPIQFSLMLTDSYDDTFTPEIADFFNSVRAGTVSLTSGQYSNYALLANTFAAALGLPSESAVQSLLKWLDDVKVASDLSTSGLISWLMSNSTISSSTSGIEKAIRYVHRLGQLVLIYQVSQKDDAALALVVNQPKKLQNTTKLQRDINGLKILFEFFAWSTTLGSSHSAILSALSNGNLNNQQLVQSVGVAELTVGHADDQAVLFKQKSVKDKYASWQEVSAVLQWIFASDFFGITANNLGDLVRLNYLSYASTELTRWKEVGEAFIAALKPEEAAQVNNNLNERLSNTLSTVVIRDVLNLSTNITNRNELYQYLLIDNQVSSAVKTTRIAEAIASLQLYINMALDGTEPHAKSDVVTRQFFTDWQTYNKSYSTWAGVSQLVYYPENYVDPTTRIGQTKMMDDFLQYISQNKINSDDVEDGFLQYLTSFENVANLTVISGYHDNVDTSQGKSYLIGQDESGISEYYWRTLNHSKFSDGKYPANAWSEWVKIDCAFTPYKNILQPVIYKSRLYVLWLERKEIEQKDVEIDLSSTSASTVGISDYIFELKLSHIRYDGTWRAPLTIDCSEQIKKLASDNKLEAGKLDIGLYASNDVNQNTLLSIFYLKNKINGKTSEDDIKKYTSGRFIYSDLSTKEMTASQCSEYILLMHKQLTTSEVIGVINHFAQSYSVPDSVTIPKGSTGKIAVSGSIPYINLNSENGKLLLTTHFLFSIDNTGENISEQRRKQIGLAKRHNLDENNIIYSNTIRWDYHYSILALEPGATSGKMYAYTDVAYVGYPISYNSVNYIYDTNKTLSIKLNSNYLIGYDITKDRFNSFTAVYGQEHYGSDVSRHYYTQISHEEEIPTVANATISTIVKFNNQTLKYPAKDYVDPYPEVTFDKLFYNYKPIEIDLREAEFSLNQLNIDVVYDITAKSGAVLGQQIFTIPVQKVTDNKLELLYIKKTDSGAQYIEKGAYRTRLNTLFAQELIQRAEQGIDTILSLNTQNIQEPKLGKGFYFQLTLPIYDPEIHGDEAWVKIYYTYFYQNSDTYLCYSGFLSSEHETTVTLFYPYPEDDHLLQQPREEDVYRAGWVQSRAHLQISYKKNPNLGSAGRSVMFTFDPDTEEAGVHRPGTQTLPAGIVSSVQVTNATTEPMDFAGANALYFWELFYYTPMMISKRFLQESNFSEAEKWLNYIWNPGGYIIAGELTDIYWNVRPLLEETSWNKDPLDSVDPDAVAQNDPMHYKVATFMHALDILIAQGDAAYRRLERDSLNEAKLFYVKASNLLGVEPYIHDSDYWENPLLSEAANETTEQLRQLALSILTAGGGLDVLQQRLAGVPEVIESEIESEVEVDTDIDTDSEAEDILQPLTANSLTNLFLPQVNDKLIGYWRLLEQRLYNLRHNLSISGQPLNLPVYPIAASPEALLASAALASSGEGALPAALLSGYRFEPLLASARNMVGQLTQFGANLLSVIEKQDNEELSEQLLTQAIALAHSSIDLQSQQRAELEAEQDALKAVLASAQQRFTHYSELYNENISTGEEKATQLRNEANSAGLGAQALRVAGAAANTAPNVFGFSCGGFQWGAVPTALGTIIEFSTSLKTIEAEKITQTEVYRRRREEWQLAMQQAEKDIEQVTAQLAAFDIRLKSADLQLALMKQEQENTAAQLSFLRTKFSGKTLYNWIRGKLASIYYQYFDLTQACCLMAQEAYRRDVGNNAAVFIRPGNWQSAWAGLMAGETLTLNLTQMEKAYLEQNFRGMEVTRTVSLAEVYANQSSSKFTLTDEIKKLVTGSATTGSAGTAKSGIALKNGQLEATLTLSDLAIDKDYATGLGSLRRIKQISVTLPALVGPYQDVRAVLNYGGSAVVPRGCDAIAVSHGMNDSGQFTLDFNDPRWLPFEGIPVNDSGTLTLSLPDVKGKQQTLALSLNDIILHIRYTIQS